MTGGGLSHVDWGREKAVGGTALSILSKNYDDAKYREVFRELVKKYRIQVIYEHRVASVQREGTNIRSIVLDHAPPDKLGCPIAKAVTARSKTIAAQVFIDCSYEGDLMAKAGVSYTWGRESRDEYGESFAGARPNLAVYNIDPYVKTGDPKSGLLPFIQDMQAKPEGSADRLTMGYGFRWKFSKDADRLPIAPPRITIHDSSSSTVAVSKTRLASTLAVACESWASLKKPAVASTRSVKATSPGPYSHQRTMAQTRIIPMVTIRREPAFGKPIKSLCVA